MNRFVEERSLPVAFTALAFGVMVSFLPAVLPFGFVQALSFLGWMAPLFGAAWFLVFSSRRVNFPWFIWLPWIFWVSIYALFYVHDNGFQRSVMLLTPLIVGIAFSSVQISKLLLDRYAEYMMKFCYIFIVLGFVHGIYHVLTGAIIGGWGAAASSITASLLAVWLVARYAFFPDRKLLITWLFVACLPVFFVTRMGILVVGATLPLTLSKFSFHKRFLAVAFAFVAGLAIFQLESVQSKMFISGEGTITQAIENGINMITGKGEVDSDFRTNARLVMKEMISAEVEQAYWFGHGANAVEEITRLFDGLTHPHNDWLRVQHDYGTLGMLLLALTIFAQAFHAWRQASFLKGEAAVFMLAGAGAFIPMVLFMFTDNVILYVAWFGCLQFAMLGLGYAAVAQAKRASGVV